MRKVKDQSKIEKRRLFIDRNASKKQTKMTQVHLQIGTTIPLITTQHRTAMKCVFSIVDFIDVYLFSDAYERVIDCL